MGGRTRKFVSKAQQAWAWATKQSFRRRKSRTVGEGYRRMPRKKGRK